ncbi:hypothetical protein GCM10023340_10560 [Nocardioides marinquilinus]|uniref:Uncharacterized protein n=1 Tax=Nocardioides marinquilinus TaxID=1210400 RepID=A0ABP9PBN3_9ACTN
MPSFIAFRREGNLWLVAVVAAVLLVACVALYLLYAAYLLAFADEGALPPRWRIPDLPAGASVIHESKECASGGCWRQLTIQPGRGQTANDLAGELGLSGGGRREGWKWYDPHSVSISGGVYDGHVRMDVGY